MGGSPLNGIKQENKVRQAKLLGKQNDAITNLVQELNMKEADIKNIVEKNVVQLVELLNCRKLTSLELVAAYSSRTGTIGAELCLITDPVFTLAIEAARKCDQIRKKTNKQNWIFSNGAFDSQKYLPPLFGIPISIKDSFDIEGFSSTVGLLSRTEPKKQSSPIVTCLRNAGMIPFTKSNMPQLGMSFQTMNQLWGRSCNPWNKERATGGSSGGQGGLVASLCSPLGLGSDIGGSVRIPAEFCGICGIKPSSSRVSGNYHTYFSSAFEGASKGVPLCIGPLAKCVMDLALELKVMYSSQFYGSQNIDAYNKLIPFDQKVFLNYSTGKTKYKIGYISSLRDIEPTKTSSRAVEQSLTILRKLGHQVVPIQIPNERQIIKEFFFENLASGAAHYRDMLKNEKPAEQYQTLFKLSQLWSPTRGLLALVAPKLSPRLNYYVISTLGTKSAHQFMIHLGRIQQFKREWVSFWKKQKLDFVICPGFGVQAVPHSTSKQISLAAAYTFLWNVLDVPAGTMPITVVKENQQEYQSQFNDLLTTKLKEVANNSVGMPAGIQVIGFPLQDQKVLGLMSTLEKEVKFSQKHRPKI